MGEFGDAVKALMKDRGVPHEQLARRVGIHEQTVDGWLTRGVLPHLPRVHDIAKALDVPPDTLLKPWGRDHDARLAGRRAPTDPDHLRLWAIAKAEDLRRKVRPDSVSRDPEINRLADAAIEAHNRSGIALAELLDAVRHRKPDTPPTP